MIKSLGQLDNPADATSTQEGCVYFTVLHQQDYLDDPPPGEASGLELHVLLNIDNEGRRCLMTTEDIRGDHTSFNDICADTGLIPVRLDAPMQLETVSIPKPWGREIWYTGVEARGISSVQGHPLSWLADVFGEQIGCNSELLLLKILDPFPEENIGDLYFEMHEEKKEVYIVTHVDEAAWPDGTGGIRYGFNQKVRKQYPDREAFLAAYLEAVSQYRQVRLEVDQLAGKGASRDRYLELLAHLPADLAKREAALREEMYAFTAMQTLKVGDVIAVDTLVPHSLQHGVRVVEFQTPHYERYILSFGQQVLTQEHWDTATAISRAVVDAPSSMDPEEVCPGQELIADFDAFRVYRLELDPGQHISIDQPAYSIVIGIYGSTSLRYGDVEVTVGAEAAYLVPASPSPTTYASSGGEPACLLVAEEKTGSAR